MGNNPWGLCVCNFMHTKTLISRRDPSVVLSIKNFRIARDSNGQTLSR